MKSINPRNRIHWFAATTLLLWLLPAASVLALSTDKDQPIMVEADSMEVDDRKGLTIYQGNVVLDQGSIHMTADKVTIVQKTGKADQVIAVGNPVKFKQRPDGKDEDIKGSSKRLEYETDSELIYMIGNAELFTDSGSSTKSDRITYDRLKAVMTAGAKAKGSGRVRTIIEPSKKGNTGK